MEKYTASEKEFHRFRQPVLSINTKKCPCQLFLQPFKREERRKIETRKSNKKTARI